MLSTGHACRLTQHCPNSRGLWPCQRTPAPRHTALRSRPARLQAAVQFELMSHGGHGDGYALLLSTVAGLSTSIGGALAVTRQPDEGALAFLLGTAIGVMATVSSIELWLRNAMHNSPLWVTAAMLAGAGVFCILDPLLPKPPDHGHDLSPDSGKQQESDDDEERRSAAPLLGRDEGARVVKVSATSARIRAPQRTGSLSNSPSGAAAAAGVKGAALTSSNSSSSNLAPRQELLQQAARSSPASNSPSSTKAASGSAAFGGPGGSSQWPPAQSRQPATLYDSAPDTGAASQAAAARHTASGSDGDGTLPDAIALLMPPPGAHSRSSSKSMEEFGGPAAAFNTTTSSGNSSSSSSSLAAHHAGLLRLGILMAVTMTLHNLPEGFAVAFSAFTDVGPLMALAIALHNIPEGVVVAAPIYAATGSRWRAVAAATASGLSEPLGAGLALLVFKPFVTSVERLEYLLAFVGGVMLAVCVVELWPEARRCKRDMRLMQGVLLGVVVMGWTLWVGV